MSDDSFIREVDEELRSDRMQAIWSQYGKFIIAFAVLIVVATAGYRGWLYWTQQQAANSGDRFVEAVELSNDGKHEEAIVILEGLGKDGYGQYPALARIRIAAEIASSGEAEEAIKAFDAIAADTGFDETLRNVARLRAGLLLVDNGNYDQVADRLELMAGTGHSFRHSAREGLGLAAWKSNDLKQAYKWFSAVSEDVATPTGVRARVQIMLSLLAGSGVDSAQ